VRVGCDGVCPTAVVGDSLITRVILSAVDWLEWDVEK
jgi:hypothetical protein